MDRTLCAGHAFPAIQGRQGSNGRSGTDFVRAGTPPRGSFPVQAPPAGARPEDGQHYQLLVKPATNATVLIGRATHHGYRDKDIRYVKLRYSNSPFFAPDFLAKYVALMSSTFKTVNGWGEDAKLKSPPIRDKDKGKEQMFARLADAMSRTRARFTQHTLLGSHAQRRR